MKKIFCAVIFMFFASPFFSLGAGIQISAKPAIVSSPILVTGTSLKDTLEENSASTTLKAPVSSKFAIGESVFGTFKMERIPIVISGGIDLFHYADSFNFGADISTDYLFFENQIVNIVNWYGGAGLAGSVLLNKNSNTTLKGGLRFLLGLNWHFFDGYLEFYTQEVASPELIYNISSKDTTFTVEFPLELGIRFHF